MRKPHRNLWVACAVAALVLTACARQAPQPVPSTDVTVPIATATSTPDSTASAGATSSTAPEGQDPVIAGPLNESPGATGTIEGYLVDFVKKDPSTGQVMLEVFAMRDGSVLTANESEPLAASYPAPARPQPESAADRDQRERTLQSLAATVGKQAPTFAGVRPQVYGYLVQVTKRDKTKFTMLVLPGPGGSFGPTGISAHPAPALKPWSDASSGSDTDLD